MRTISGSDSKRYDFIDMLRGWAAIAVVVYHSIRAYERAGWSVAPWEGAVSALLQNWLNLGKIGVAVFFIISGFVIPSSLRRGQANQITRFIVSRVARLFPAYWLSILAALAVYHFCGLPVPSGKVVGANFTMLQQFLRVDNVISVYWTLQIELIFYVLCAVFFATGKLYSNRFLRNFALGMIGLALALACVRWQTRMKLPVAVPIAISLMFLGALARSWIIGGDGFAKRAVCQVAGAIACLIIPISLLAYNFDAGFGETWGSYACSYLAALALAGVGVLGRRDYSWLVTWLGKVSYSVYLFHYLIVVLLVFIIQGTGSYRPSLFVFTGLAIVVSVVVSSLVYIAVERPAIALARRETTVHQ